MTLTEAMPAGATLENSSAAKGFKFCSHIFSIEKRLKELSDEERLKARIDQVKPVVDEYWKWLDELVFNSNSKLGEAVTYSKNQKKILNRFLEYGNIDISNNQAENAIRPFVIYPRFNVIRDNSYYMAQKMNFLPNYLG